MTTQSATDIGRTIHSSDEHNIPKSSCSFFPSPIYLNLYHSVNKCYAYRRTHDVGDLPKQTRIWPRPYDSHLTASEYPKTTIKTKTTKHTGSDHTYAISLGNSLSNGVIGASLRESKSYVSEKGMNHKVIYLPQSTNIDAILSISWTKYNTHSVEVGHPH